MEGPTAPEVASESKLKGEDVNPADADGTQASPGREVGSPTAQLLPPIEGEGEGGEAGVEGEDGRATLTAPH